MSATTLGLDERANSTVTRLLVGALLVLLRCIVVKDLWLAMASDETRSLRLLLFLCK